MILKKHYYFYRPNDFSISIGGAYEEEESVDYRDVYKLEISVSNFIKKLIKSVPREGVHGELLD